MQIKKIVSECRIDEEREQFKIIKDKLFLLERKMANLTLDYGVGTYVHMLEEYSSLEPTDKRRKELKRKLKVLGYNPSIIKYLEFKKYYDWYSYSLSNYAKGINVEFRNLVGQYKVPDVFVFQGYVDEYKRIASAKNIVIPKVDMLYCDEKTIMIYPSYDITSNRELRHFYNRVSYKYLEAMTNDYCFDNDSKNIGKVKIKK